jgi:predicted MFS family arabinose efflux permease
LFRDVGIVRVLVYAAFSRGWWALILLCVAQFVDVLDINAVIVALPTIGQELGFGPEDLQWVVTAYVLFFGGFLLLAGRLADLFGRRKMFTAGLALFAASSLLCGLAWSPLMLVVFRAAQGLGAAIVAPAALSIISITFPEGRERNLAMGVWTAVATSTPTSMYHSRVASKRYRFAPAPINRRGQSRPTQARSLSRTAAAVNVEMLAEAASYSGGPNRLASCFRASSGA